MTIPCDWYLGQTSTSSCSDVGGPLTLESLDQMRRQLESPVQAKGDLTAWAWDHPCSIIVCHPVLAPDFEAVIGLYPALKGMRVISFPTVERERVYLMDRPEVLRQPWPMPSLADIVREHRTWDVSMSLPSVRCEGPARYVRVSKNQAGIWWSWSWRRKKKVYYRRSRRPIRGPQYRSTPYWRSCLDNYGNYKGVQL